MAQEQILTVSLRDYKKQIDDLKASLAQLDRTSGEYKNNLAKVRDMQSRLNEAMNVAKVEAQHAEGSYNALRQTMSKLTAEWRATADTMKQKELGKQILDINKKLKKMDEDIGNFQRNVGDYSNQFASAMQQFGGGIPKTIANIQFLGKAIKTSFATNPVGLFILAIAGLFALLNKVKAAIGGNEELQNRWNVAMARFQPIVIAINGVLQKMADWLIKVVDWVGKAANAFADWIGLIPDANETMQKSVELQERENRLNERAREIKVENAELSRKLAKLNDEAAKQIDKHSEKYKKLLQQQKAVKTQIAENNKYLKEEAQAIREGRAALAPNSKAENDALAQGKADIIETETELSNALAGYDRRLSRANATTKEATEVQKSYNDTLKESLSILEGQLDRYAKLNDIKGQDRLIQAGKDRRREESLIIEQLTRQQNSYEILTAEAEKFAKSEKLNAEEKEEWAKKANDYAVKAMQTQQKLEKAVFTKNLRDIQTEADEAIRLISRMDKAAGGRGNIARDDFSGRSAALTDAYTQEVEGYRAMIAELEKEHERLAAIGLSSDSDEWKEIARKIQEAQDGIVSSTVSYNDDMDSLGREREESEKRHTEAVNAAMVSLAKKTGDIFGQIADIQEENIRQKLKDGKISQKRAEEEFERTKKLQSAQLWVSTIAGATGAWMQDMKTYPSPWNLPIAISDMALAMSTGIAQQKKLNATTLEGGSGSSGGGMQSASVNPLLNQKLDTETMNTVGLMGNRTAENRVYILESDITESNSRVSVRENSTRF